MKTLLSIFLIFCSLSAQAQYKNTVSLAMQPGDLGLGLRYDRSLSPNIGLYGIITKGSYRLADKGYIKDHVRYAVGYTVLLPKRMFEETESRFTCGLVYHRYGLRKFNISDINYEKAFSPAGLELGLINRLNRFNMGIRMDLFKWEGSVDFGISF